MWIDEQMEAFEATLQMLWEHQGRRMREEFIHDLEERIATWKRELQREDEQRAKKIADDIELRHFGLIEEPTPEL